ncbi:MAG TPA: PLP-dependent aminotransferase family protein [Thermoanaerobaculia bacterium]|nr:PLP-dependent aminotransferase family protein [Thermoanaerobaculia bacterium]
MRNVTGLWLDRSARPTLQDQLARQIRDRIRSGELAPGDMLPSTRDLAAELNISRNTAVYAYERLISEGFLQSEPRAGVFVTPSIAMPRRLPRRQSPETRAERSLAEQPSISAPRPFRPCQPDVGLFPLVTWNRMRGRALRREGRNILHYQASCVAGVPKLRENVATYLRDHRGVQCDPHQVVITAGSQQALFLLAMLLLKPRDHAWVEDPGYAEARMVFRNQGARIVPGRVDEQGLTLPPEEHRKLSVLYTTPSRQFPTGVSLSLQRRLGLIDFATSTRAWIIEDDYDSELRYGAPPLPSLQSLDRSGCVIYTGTFSKVLFPSLRLGYVVMPDALVDRFIEIKHLIDDHLPLVDQATLALFLESGAFYSHIRRCRREYAARHALFLELFAKSGLPLTFAKSDGGMNVVGFLPDGADDSEWSRRLREGGFDVPALSSYAIEKTRPGLVFGFTAFSAETLRAEFRRMRPILEQAARDAVRLRRRKS